MTKRYPIVALEWVDAHANSGWFTEDQIDAQVKSDWYCTDVGIILRETPKVILFAQRFSPVFDDDSRQWGSLHRIPKTWVRKRIVLGYFDETGKVARPEARKEKRATHRSTKGPKLYALGGMKSRLKDIQTYEKAHERDMKRKHEETEAARRGGTAWTSVTWCSPG